MIIKDDAKRAVLEIYEELFNAMNAINADSIFDNLLVLMKKYDMEELMEGVDSDMINVVHESEVHKANQKHEDFINYVQNLINKY